MSREEDEAFDQRQNEASQIFQVGSRCAWNGLFVWTFFATKSNKVLFFHPYFYFIFFKTYFK